MFWGEGLERYLSLIWNSSLLISVALIRSLEDNVRLELEVAPPLKLLFEVFLSACSTLVAVALVFCCESNMSEHVWVGVALALHSHTPQLQGLMINNWVYFRYCPFFFNSKLKCQNFTEWLYLDFIFQDLARELSLWLTDSKSREWLKTLLLSPCSCSYEATPARQRRRQTLV